MQVNSQSRDATAATAVANANAAAASNKHKHDRNDDHEDNNPKGKRLRSEHQLAEALTSHGNNTDPLLDSSSSSSKFYDAKDSSIQSSALVSEAVQRHVQKIVEQSQLSSRSGDPRMESAFQTTNNQRPVSPPRSKSENSTQIDHHDHHDHHELSESSALGDKPQVGSDEWHKLRRDNHKEVERRRRENINKGINLLAEVVPECDKQKGQILKKAHEYIIKLKTAETQNLEKYTLEKLLSEQAISELSATNKSLKLELNQAWRECNVWKKACERHGITDPSQ